MDLGGIDTFCAYFDEETTMSGKIVGGEWVAGVGELWLSQTSAGGLFFFFSWSSTWQQISLLDKLSLINATEHGNKQVNIARRMGLSRQTVNLTVK